MTPVKLTVCFKAIADYAMLSRNDWTGGPENRVDLQFVRQGLSCFDESGLETGLALAESRSDLSWELTALTLDKDPANLFLRLCLAAGFHRAVRIAPAPDQDLRFDPLFVARVIAAHIGQEEGPQAVILGPQGGEGDNGQTGYLVAEILGWPCIEFVSRISVPEPENRLRVESRLDRSTLVQTIDLPVVLIMGNTPDAPYLRVPTLIQKLAAKKKEICQKSLSDLEVRADSRTGRTLTGLIRPEPDRSCTFIQGASPAEKAKILYETHLKERLAR